MSQRRRPESAEGDLVAFSFKARDLVASVTNSRSDVFVTAIAAGDTSLVSRTVIGHVPNDASYRPAVSADGGYVAFESLASDLAIQDPDNENDIFLTRLS